MTAQNRPLAFASVAERLGKIIPRLASDHPGEVAATVAAIGRLLQGAGLDWHDLGQRVAAPSFDDIMGLTAKVKSSSTTAPQSEPTASTEQPAPKKPPGCSDAEWERALRRARGEKVGRQPPPWPTWGSLSHFGKLAWMDVILRDGGLSVDDAEAFKAIHGPYYRHQEWSRKGANVFNRHVRAMWERGWRPDGKATA